MQTDTAVRKWLWLKTKNCTGAETAYMFEVFCLDDSFVQYAHLQTEARREARRETER